MNLSIVIPAFEESSKITHDIQEAAQFLNKQDINGEIIVVDDGSKDNTSEIAKSVKVSKDIQFKVITYKPNRGKGHAVKTGIAQTTGEFVMFADSGVCISFDNALVGLEMLNNNECDIAHASRKLPNSNIIQPQSFYRHLWSILFHWFVVIFMKVPAELSDTQCGFKIYKGDDARRLFSNCITEGFTFDIEIILRAKKQGLKIREFPVTWKWDTDSRLHPVRLLIRVFSELMAIRKNLK